MKRTLLATAVAGAAITAMSAQAMACPDNYKKVWIQGNPVCMLDVSASNNLTALPPAPQPSAVIKGKKAKIKLRRSH